MSPRGKYSIAIKSVELDSYQLEVLTKWNSYYALKEECNKVNNTAAPGVI